MQHTVQNLQRWEREYWDISGVFLRSASGRDFHLEIQSIQRITNPMLHKKFKRKEEEYMASYGQVRIVPLFHGTKKSNIPSILEKNLEVARHGQNIGHRFGNGVSFSALSHYASHYCDRHEEKKQMLLCWVLISHVKEVPEVKRGHGTFSQPPLIEGQWFLRYDTTAKNKEKMDVIVKYEDHTYIPMYIINFKKIPNALERVPQPQMELRVVHDGGEYVGSPSNQMWAQNQMELEYEIDENFRSLSEDEIITISSAHSADASPPPHQPPKDPCHSCAGPWIAIFILVVIFVLWMKGFL